MYYASELYHHGIEGQKWGVQKGPPYPLDRKRYEHAQKLQYSTNKITNKGFRPSDLRRKHTIPAGTTMYRTTTDANENNSGATYVSYMDADREHYKGGWIRQIQGGKQTYENEYTLTKDLVVPSRDELYSVINDVVKKNQKSIDKICKDWLDIAMPEGSYERMERSTDWYTGEESKKIWKEYTDSVIKEFGNKTLSEAGYFVAQTFGTNLDVRGQVISELKKRGYNAMTDEASVGGQGGYNREGVDPLIIFEGADSLYKQKTTKIDNKSESKSANKYNKWVKNANSQKAKSKSAGW